MPDATAYEPLMRRALELASFAASRGEVPIGCVIAREGVVVAEVFNEREAGQDPTAHAEVLAIRRASRALGSFRLEGCVLAVTCEPCPMCAGAIVLARIATVVFGCVDPKGGGVVSRYGIGIDGQLNHRFEVVSGIMAEEASALLRDFFSRLRSSP